MSQRQTLTPTQAYHAYYGPAIFEPLTRHVVDLAAPRPGDRVLDVACGTGITTRHLAERVGPTGMVVAVDVNPAMLDVACALPEPEGAPIEWRLGDGTALGLPDAGFDLVCCQQGLQFFADRAAGAREMRRVLVDGGRAVVAVWRGVDEHPFYRALADIEEPHLAPLGAGMTSGHRLAPFSFGDPDSLGSTFAAAGFGEIEVSSWTIQARFADADRFVEQMELAYAAVIPAFTQDRAAFDAFVSSVERAAEALVEAHRDGDEIVVPMHTHIAVGHTPFATIEGRDGDG